MLLNAKRDIESVVEGKVLDVVEYHAYSMKYATLFEAGIGAEAIYEIFKTVDLKELEAKIVLQLYWKQ